MDYFKTFSVKINQTKDVDEHKKWPGVYKVLVVDMNQQTERILKEKKVGSHKKSAKQLVTQKDLEDPEDDTEIELTEDDYTTQESITIFLLLGNDKTGELRWFDSTEVSYAGVS